MTRMVGFSPSDRSTFEKVLRGCAARLSPRGLYHPDTLTDPQDRTLPDADTSLRVSDTWVIYVRQRSADFRREDLGRLIKRVEEIEEPEELPAPGVRFVVEPSDEVVDPDYGSLDLTSPDLELPGYASERVSPISAGCSGSEPNNGQRDVLFFPLPFNDEQEDVIRRLEAEGSPGVTVQGPRRAQARLIRSPTSLRIFSRRIAESL